MATSSDQEEFSSVLFVNEDGTPMHFYMRPCKERGRIKRLVQDGGGILSSKADANSIKLTEDPDSVKSDDYYLPSYVTDCVEENQLLELNAYKVTSGSSKLRSASSDSDIFVSPDKNLVHIRGSAKEKKGRNKYLLSEDMNIINYILNEDRMEDLSGNLIWKDMAKLEITKHPWQSMRDRFRKYITPAIDSYGIKDKRKMAKLKQALGYTSSKSSSEGKPVSDNKSTVNVWRTTKSKTVDNDPEAQAVVIEIEDGSQPETAEVTDDKIDETDKKLLSKARIQDQDRSPRVPSVKKLPAVRRKLDSYTEESSVEHESMKGSPSKVAKMSPVKESNKEVAVVKPTGISSPSKQRYGKSPDKGISREAQIAPPRTPSPRKLCSKQTESPKTPQTLARTLAKRRMEQLQKENAVVDLDTSKDNAIEGKKDLGTLDGMALVNFVMSDTQSDAESSSGNSPRRLTRSSGQPQAKMSPRINTRSTDRDSDQVAVEPECMPHRKVNRKRARDAVVSSVEEESVTEGSYVTAQEDLQSTDDSSEKPDRKEVQEIASMIRKISEWLSLDVLDFLVVMHLNNGSIDEAVHWLLNGHNSKGEKAWTKTYDKLLMTDDTNALLVSEYGKDAMQKRKNYLISSKLS